MADRRTPDEEVGRSHAEIERLVYSYAKAIDEGDLETFGALFARGTLAIGGTPVAATGADAVRAMVGKGLHWYGGDLSPAPTPRTKHLTANLSIEVDPGGERARAHSYVMVFQALDDFPLQAILGAHYDDELVRDEGAWRFERRVLTYDLLGDLSRHFMKPVPPARSGP